MAGHAEELSAVLSADVVQKIADAKVCYLGLLLNVSYFVDQQTCSTRKILGCVLI